MDGSDDRIGSRVAQLRTAAGLKQSDLSAMLRRAGLNWSQATLSKVESGQRPVRLSEATVLADALDVDLSALLSNPDYIGALREASDRTVAETRNQVVRAQRDHWKATTQSRAVRLFEEIRDGSRGPYKVYGGDFVDLLDYVTGGIGPIPSRKLEDLLESLHLDDLRESLTDLAQAAVSSWVDGDRDDMPEALLTPSRLGFGAEYWLLQYDNAVAGDERALEDLVGDVFTELAVPALEAALGFIEFVDPTGAWPRRIEGLTGGPDEVAMPTDMLSGDPAARHA